MKHKHVISAAALLAAVCAAHGAVTLFDFEDEAERKSAPRKFANDRTICVTNVLATSGEHALYFRSGPWRKGLDRWPSFNLHTSVRDWRGYDRLVIDLVSAGEGEDTLGTFICAPDGRRGPNATTTLPSRGYRQWVVPLRNKWPKNFDPANVGRVHLYLYDPRDVRVFIDRITLLKEGESLPVPDGPLVGRDLIPFLSKASSEAAAFKGEFAAACAHLRAYCSFREACLKAGQDTSEMSVGVASPMANVLPRGPEIPAAPATNATLRLARNERESLQIVVAPGDRDLSGVRVRVSDLRRADGAVFAATNVACDIVGYVHTVRKPPYQIGRWIATNAAPGWVRSKTHAQTGWWPDPILDFLDGVDVKDADVQSFWVRVHCPEGQPAGIYDGTLTVSADGVRPRDLPFRVRVNDFAVPKESPLPLAVSFAPGTFNQSLRKDPDWPGNTWSSHEGHEFVWGDFLADYYITMGSIYVSNHWKGKIRWDVLRRLREQGRLGYYNLGYWDIFVDDARDRKGNATVETEAEWRDDTVKWLKGNYAKAKELGILDRAYLYGCDEVHTNYFSRMRRCVEILKEELPGVPVSTTAKDAEFGMGTPLDAIDWFTPLTPKYNAEKAAKSRAAGHQVWWYICCDPKAPWANMFVECPAIEGRILMGAATARMRPDGFLYWAVAFWGSPRRITSGPFTDWNPCSVDRYHGDGCWTCAGPDDKPLPTLRLENFRDGLEDYAYALELEKKLKARANADDAWAKRAKELLAVPGDVMQSMTQFTGDPATVLRWRDDMADLIEAAK